MPTNAAYLESLVMPRDFNADDTDELVTEMKTFRETLERHDTKLCATPDILQDASYSVESWLIEKTGRAFLKP